MAKKFQVWFKVSASVETAQERTLDWVDANVLPDLMDDLVREGFTVDDCGVKVEYTVAGVPWTIVTDKKGDT